MSDLKSEGYYKGTIKAISIEEVNDKERLSIEFDVEGDRLWYSGFFTPDAEEYTFEHLGNADVNKTMGGDLNKLQTMVGNVCDITVRHSTYEGKTRAIVRFINGPRKTKPVSAGRMTALQARMAAKLGAQPSAGGEEVPFSV